MGQHDPCDTTSSNNVYDTIAFGSMLVFASVMPPLGSELDARSPRKRAEDRVEREPDLAKKPASGSPRRFDS